MNNQNASRRSANATARSKSVTGKVGKQRLPARWFITFTGLTLFVVGIALLVPNQTPEQIFYFRIIIALSASGLAAIIPGFFDITLRWLRSTVRAGGAVAILLLVYQFNPPPLTTEVAPCLSSSDLAGTFRYIFTSTSGDFPNGENQHAGRVHFQGQSTGRGSKVSAWGVRELSAKQDHSGTQILPVNSVASWQTDKVSHPSEEEIQFEYTTTDKDGINTGVTKLKIFRNDKGEVVRLEGTFKRNAPYDHIVGTVSMVRETNSASRQGQSSF